MVLDLLELPLPVLPSGIFPSILISTPVPFEDEV
jgi:hypothetical protein